MGAAFLQGIEPICLLNCMGTSTHLLFKKVHSLAFNASRLFAFRHYRCPRHSSFGIFAVCSGFATNHSLSWRPFQSKFNLRQIQVRCHHDFLMEESIWFFLQFNSGIFVHCTALHLLAMRIQNSWLVLGVEMEADVSILCFPLSHLQDQAQLERSHYFFCMLFALFRISSRLLASRLVFFKQK